MNVNKGMQILVYSFNLPFIKFCYQIITSAQLVFSPLVKLNLISIFIKSRLHQALPHLSQYKISLAFFVLTLLRKLFPPPNGISQSPKSNFLNSLSTSLSLNTSYSLCLHLILRRHIRYLFLHFFSLAFHWHNHFLFGMPLLLLLLVLPCYEIRSHVIIVYFNQLVFYFSL